MSTHTYAVRAAAGLTVTGTGVLTRLTGRAVPYNTPADIGRFTEEFAPAAFTASLATTPNVPLLVQHDPLAVVGVATGWEDRADGLHGVWRLDDTPDAQYTARRVEAGMLPFLSVRFQPDELAGQWTFRRGVKDHVRWNRARLIEVSLTTIPAYATANVSDVRSVPGGDPAAAAFGLVSALAADLGDDMVRSAITGPPDVMTAAAGLVRLAVETEGADAARGILDGLAVAAHSRGQTVLAVNLARAARCVDRDQVTPQLRDFHADRYRVELGLPPVADTSRIPPRRRRRNR